tara:strand:- start:14482 stop:14904 length:423 start_codon:yes stop_codon:yes gene_type:complete
MRVFLLTLVVVFAATSAKADNSLPETETAAIRTVIQDQLDAFNRDDGVRAFSHASPDIQGIFQTVEVFMTMVRSGYQPFYRSARHEFGQLHVVDGEPIQEVYVTGQDGMAALAVYTMQQQPDGTWKINGCSLYPVPDVSV